MNLTTLAMSANSVGSLTAYPSGPYTVPYSVASNAPFTSGGSDARPRGGNGGNGTGGGNCVVMLVALTIAMIL
jgi:hypothetical protein